MGHPTESVAGNVLVKLFFTDVGTPLGYGQAFVVRFAVPPKVGDLLEIDQYSVKAIPQEELHCTEWCVVDVRHTLQFDCRDEREPEHPLVTLSATVHPVR